MDPKSYLPYPFLALAYEQKHEYAKAIAAFETAVKMEPDVMEAKAQLAHAYALAKQPAKAREILQFLIAEKRYVSPYVVALIYVALGDKDKAFEWLDKAFTYHDEWLAS